MDWQPIAKLAQQLSQTSQSMNAGALPWNHAVIHAEGVWQAYAHQQSAAWPPSLWLPRPNPPRPVVPARQPFWKRIFRFWQRPRSAPAPLILAPPIMQPPALATSLTACYTSLSAQILQQTTQWFSPYWTELPAELAVVSERAVIWALYAWALQGKQTDAILQDPFLPATKYAVAVDSRPGDAFCLHINLEQIMQSLLSEWQIRQNTPTIQLRPGGLRTESFLHAYAALSSPHAPPEAQVWRKAVDRLIEGSPLTQLVYVDLVGGHRLPAACADVVRMRLHETADQDLLRRQEEWRNLWYAQLARCLLGALLNEAPVCAELQEAEQRLRSLESLARTKPQEPRRQRNAKQRGFIGDINAKLPELRQQCHALRRKRATQYLERVERISSLFQDAQGNRRCTYLQMRLLDMLLRHVVTQAMPAMLEEWRRLDPETKPWARTELFNAGGACFNTLTATLLGYAAFDDFLSLLAQEQKQSLRRNLEILLDLPQPTDLLQRASEAGVGENAAARGWARFSGEPVGGIPLPLPAPNDLAPAPQALLDDWLPLLLNRLPQASVTVVASGEEYDTANEDSDEPYGSYDY
jgi:hypothetical protein